MSSQDSYRWFAYCKWIYTGYHHSLNWANLANLGPVSPCSGLTPLPLAWGNWLPMRLLKSYQPPMQWFHHLQRQKTCTSFCLSEWEKKNMSNIVQPKSLRLLICGLNVDSQFNLFYYIMIFIYVYQYLIVYSSLMMSWILSLALNHCTLADLARCCNRKATNASLRDSVLVVARRIGLSSPQAGGES